MKSLLKLIFLVAVFMLAAPFALQSSDIQWPQSLSKLLEQMPLLSKLTATSEPVETEKSVPDRNSSTSVQSDISTSIYRWQDEQGQWHYSDKPPKDQTSESVILAPVNQITLGKAHKTPERSDAQTQPLQEVKLPDSLSKSDPDELLKQVEDSKRLIQARQAEIDALIQSQ